MNKNGKYRQKSPERANSISVTSKLLYNVFGAVTAGEN